MPATYKARLLIGLTLLISGGCCAPYQSYPYGGGGYVVPPGMTVPPTIVTPPSGTLGPGSTAPPGNLGPGTPSSGNRGQIRNGHPAPKTADGASSSDAGRGDGAKPVPIYRDPNQPTAPDPRRTSPGAESSPFEDSSGTGTESTRHQGVAARSESRTATLIGSTEQGFQPPIRQLAGEQAEPSTSAASGAASSQPNPYDHDRKGFRWLRGVVDFDAKDKSWFIIYDTAPDRTDKYGGGFTLTGKDRFTRLRDRDVVLVEGSIDFDRRDRSGKPVYRVDRLRRLAPRTQVSPAPGLVAPKTARRSATGGPRVVDGTVGNLER